MQLAMKERIALFVCTAIVRDQRVAQQKECSHSDKRIGWGVRDSVECAMRWLG